MSKLLKPIAAAEMIGGAAALSLALPNVGAILSESASVPTTVLCLGYLLLVFVLSLVAGVLLWRSSPLGLPLSACTQLLQVPWLELSRFTYQLDTGLRIPLAFGINSGLLTFEADVGNLRSVIGPGSEQPVVIGVNLAALAILVHLLRRMAYERRVRRLGPRVAASMEPPPLPLPRRMLRFGLRMLWIGTAVVVVPVLAFWLYNRIDESPTARAHHWFTALPQPANDRDNAWLFLMGLGAAEGDEPAVLGRRRLAAFEARIADRRATGPSAAEQALETDPLPFRETTDAHGKPFGPACNARTQDCLAWARRHAAELARLEADNATRLTRYDALLGMADFIDPSRPTPDVGPSYSTPDANLYRALIARDLGQPSSRAAALQRLVRVTAFWQRANEPAQSRLIRGVAELHIELGMRLLDTLLNRADAAGVDAIDAAARSILKAPTPALRQWEAVIRRETLELVDSGERVVPDGVIDALFRCRSDCLKNWIIAQLHVPQATRNRAAELADAILAVHMADASDIDAAAARVGALIDDLYPNRGHWKEMLGKVLHNLTGEAMVGVFAPAYGDFLYKQHDLENLRRMILIKMSAIRQRIAPAAMPRFLAAQPAELRNVYTGAAFEWHAASQQIRFAPKSKRFKLEHLSVSYLAGR